MASPVKKRSIVIAGHKTSVSLEDDFWSGVKEIAKISNTSIEAVVANIDASRLDGNLSSAIRSRVLSHYRAAAMAQVQTQACESIAA